jgi:hypothetical protein
MRRVRYVVAMSLDGYIDYVECVELAAPPKAARKERGAGVAATPAPGKVGTR